jgi:hypothetical protein
MYKFICICLVIMFPLLAWGDSEKDIQDPYKGVVVKKFEIKTITGDVKINIQASLNYVIEEEKFKLKLKIDDDSDSLMLEKNIHWKIFLQEFRDTIYSRNWIEERKAVTEDIHQIYYWFYCLVHKSDNAYNSGIVFIKDKVLVVQQDGNRFGNYEDRMMVIDYIKKQEGDKQTNLSNYYNLPDDITGVQVHEIDSVALQFERGFLENVKVYTKHREKTYMFENIYAIGFSSKYNFKELSKMKLYERNTSGIFPCLYLGDVISYDETLSSYTRDYSPQDTVVSISPAQVPFSILQRSKMVDLFDAKIYSDLIGLLNETPNGMIQIEVDKRLNIRTIRKQVGSFRQNFGWLSYINLWGAFTKIEANNKGLPIRNLNRVQNGQIVSPNYVSNLDLLRYETFVLGTEVNGLVYDIPDAKVTGYFDLGIKYSHVPMLDSTRTVDYLGNVTVDAPVNKFDGHLLSLQPKITIEVRTEKRIHFKLSYWYYHSWLFSNNRFKQVMSYEKSDLSNLLLEPKARQIHSVEFYFRTQLSEISQSKLFIRARLHWQSGDANTFFPQLQLGYSYDLFYKR